MYDMDGLGGAGWAGWLPDMDDVSKGAQAAVGVVAGAAVAKWLTTTILDFNLKKEKDANGVVTYKFKPKGSEVEVAVAASRDPAALDAGRGLFGGQVGAALPGLAPILVGLGFYSKGQRAESEGGKVWMTSAGFGMLGYGLGYIFKSILERVDIDYTKLDPATGAYAPKASLSPWAAKTAAYIPFGAVDTYESNIVINGLGYAGPVRGYMAGRGVNPRAARYSPMMGLGYSRSPGAPTFVERLNSAPTEIQTLVSSSGVSAAPQTVEPVGSFQGLSATLM